MKLDSHNSKNVGDYFVESVRLRETDPRKAYDSLFLAFRGMMMYTGQLRTYEEIWFKILEKVPVLLSEDGKLHMGPRSKLKSSFGDEEELNRAIVKAVAYEMTGVARGDEAKLHEFAEKVLTLYMTPGKEGN
jgi:hypothetical protein